MNVKELIQVLQTMPQDAKVYHLWDGELRTVINVVYESMDGDVVTADYNEVCYYIGSRPINNTEALIKRYWKTSNAPKGYDDDNYND